MSDSLDVPACIPPASAPLEVFAMPEPMRSSALDWARDILDDLPHQPHDAIERARRVIRANTRVERPRAERLLDRLNGAPVDALAQARRDATDNTAPLERRIRAWHVLKSAQGRPVIQSRVASPRSSADCPGPEMGRGPGGGDAA